MTDKERIRIKDAMIGELWARCYEYLVNTSATPKLISTYQKKVTEALK